MYTLKRAVKSIIGMQVKPLVLGCDALSNLKIIFTYHRIAQQRQTGLHDPAMFVSADTLEMNLRQVSSLFEIVPLETLVNAHGEKRRLCAITLDDGWKDNYDYAFPIFKKYGCPATIFLSTSMIGTEKKFWFQLLWEIADEAKKANKTAAFGRYFHQYAPRVELTNISIEQIIKLIRELKEFEGARLEQIVYSAQHAIGVVPISRRDILNWSEIHEMSQHNISFGSHGLHHNILTRLTSRCKEVEIFESKKILENTGALVSPYFSYPGGFFDSEAILFVKEAGYAGAVTGLNTIKTHPYCINRVDLHEDICNTPSLFWFRILQAAYYGCGNDS